VSKVLCCLTAYANCSTSLFTELSCFLGRDNDKPTRTKQLGNQHVHIFIEIELNEQAAHWSVTKGSMNSSGIRLSAMYRSISG